jgi:hypothetical protein
MFTTPARSENKPPRAAKIIGTDNKSAADAVPILVKFDAPVMTLMEARANSNIVA